MGSNQRSYQTLHQTRHTNGSGPILTYSDLATAEEEVKRQYPEMRISAVIPLNLSDDNEYNGIGVDDDTYPIQVYLAPKRAEKMPPDVRETTRKFWIQCGFDQYPLRSGRANGEVETVIQALLLDEIRPIDLCYLEPQDWDDVMSPYVSGQENRLRMREQFLIALDCERE